MKYIEEHQNSNFFVFALFFFFAAAALSVIGIGLNVYTQTVDSAASASEMRTSLSYLTEKIHQHNQSGAVSITAVNDTPALRLREQISGQTYDTTIYVKDGELKEWFAAEGMPFTGSEGQTITTLSAFDAQIIAPGLLRLSLADTSGTRYTKTISFLEGP